MDNTAAEQNNAYLDTKWGKISVQDLSEKVSKYANVAMTGYTYYKGIKKMAFGENYEERFSGAGGIAGHHAGEAVGHRILKALENKELGMAGQALAFAANFATSWAVEHLAKRAGSKLDQAQSPSYRTATVERKPEELPQPDAPIQFTPDNVRIHSTQRDAKLSKKQIDKLKRTKKQHGYAH